MDNQPFFQDDSREQQQRANPGCGPEEGLHSEVPPLNSLILRQGIFDGLVHRLRLAIHGLHPQRSQRVRRTHFINPSPRIDQVPPHHGGGAGGIGSAQGKGRAGAYV